MAVKNSPWTRDKYGVNSEAFVVLRCAVPGSLVLHELIQRNCLWWEGGKHADQPTAAALHQSGAQPCWLWSWYCCSAPPAWPCPVLTVCSAAPPLWHTVGWPVRDAALSLGMAFPIGWLYLFLKEISNNLQGAGPTSGPEVWRGGAATSG